MNLTKNQLDALKRLEFYVNCQDGCADECHEFYCPYNISEINERSDGFNSECPRFKTINKKKGEWTCLCGLELIAMLLTIDVNELNDYLKEQGFKEPIFGYNKEWRKKSEK